MAAAKQNNLVVHCLLPALPEPANNVSWEQWTAPVPAWAIWGFGFWGGIPWERVTVHGGEAGAGVAPPGPAGPHGSVTPGSGQQGEAGSRH